nr:enoyl-CoA hydratase-related protein [Pseudonocardia sp. C8]
MEMILTGDPIDAAEAHRVGLVNRIVPLPELRSTAVALAHTIAERGPIAVRAARAAVLDGLGQDHDAAMAQEFRRFVECMRTDDAVEDATAFAEKRPPVYRGR